MLLPIAALPVVGLATQHDPALFRLSMVVVGVVYLAVAAIFLFFGGAAFAPAGLLLLAAAFGPADRPGRSRTRRTIALCPAAALTFLVVLLILEAFA